MSGWALKLLGCGCWRVPDSDAPTPTPHPHPAVEVCLRSDSIARPSDMRDRVKAYLNATVVVYKRGARQPRI